MKMDEWCTEARVLTEVGEGCQWALPATILVDVKREEGVGWWRRLWLAIPVRKHETEVQKACQERTKLAGDPRTHGILTAMLPLSSTTGHLLELTLDGVPFPFERAVLKAVEYAVSGTGWALRGDVSQ